MKKIILFLMAITLAITASAEPANPTPVSITQPDGTTLMLKLVGDEFYHFNTTTDGFTIVNVNGRWEYATKNGNRLASTGILAHDPQARSAVERQLLAATPRFLADETMTNSALKARNERDKKNHVGTKEAVIDYSKFRGLIILINFNDKQFQMSNPNSFYDQLCNTKNYNGFYHNGSFQPCTGSVRDYYFDNSMGQFDPMFDIVGPVNLDYSCYEGNDQAREIFQDALNAVDSEVDFSQYDADDNGEIDMVFFMVAGFSSSYSGNNSGYLWPHMSYLYGWSQDAGWYYLEYDGKHMGRYASSCEIYGWESYGYTMPNAIGTICHEFGHVMGLPDLYDTDYQGSGGESNHPGDWDVMAGGSHSNYGRTPVGYSLWERWELGFASEPQELTLGAKSLTAINVSNTGYKMSTSNPDEYFLFENRQLSKWDAALPGHGLVITRVDNSNPQAWWSNNVNSDPAHNYYELVRSNGNEVPFPGSTGASTINSVTDPALLTWEGQACQYGLSDITETGGTITFNTVVNVDPGIVTEDFENMTDGYTGTTDQLGNFATWNFVQATKATDSNGAFAAALKMPGGITMTSDIDVKPFKISMTAHNTASTISKVQLYYSTDGGANWKSLGSESAMANSTTQMSWRLKLDQQPVRFRINRTSGSKTVDLLIDDITIQYTDSTVYNLSLAGTQVSGACIGNLSQIDGVQGLVQYLPLSNTLCMTDATITCGNSMGISTSVAGLTINVSGNNTISSGQNGMTLGSSSTIKGDGMLQVNSSRNSGLSFNDNCVVEAGANIALHGFNYGIVGAGSAEPTLTVKGSNTRLSAMGDNASSIANLYSLTLFDGLTITSPAGAHFDAQAHSVVDLDGVSIAGQWVTIGKEASLPGDVDGDGHISSSDVTALYNYLLQGADSISLINGDQNGDGHVSAADVTIVYNLLLGN